MTHYLADGVFMAVCDEDIIVLDTRSDHYSVLPEAAGEVRLSQGVIEAADEVLQHLRTSGLVGDAPAGQRHPIPPGPVNALELHGVRPLLSDELTVCRAIGAAWLKGPGRRSLSELLSDRIVAAPIDIEMTARLTAAFVRILPWDPAQGACLYRAWLLRHALGLRAQSATWVFGVRIWPFGAHCWLQVGDAVLDDDPDRVARYTPIMAV